MGFWTKLVHALPWVSQKDTVTVVRLQGVLASGQGRNHLNMANQAKVLEEAFSYPDRKAVALIINSPGGSPVQSSLIAKRISALSEKYDVPVYAFAEDAAASGGYWLACAADEFYVDNSSIIGSIGVISSGFGFQNLIQKHGVERRVFTAGANKSTLDPFKDLEVKDVEKLEKMLTRLHGHFKDHVVAARGDKLKQEEEELFTGEFWSGSEAVELGLADGVGDLRSVLEEKFGEDVKLVPIEASQGLFSLLGGFNAQASVSDKVADSLVDKFYAKMNAQALWQRLGL